jgi:hypothetical protein
MTSPPVRVRTSGRMASRDTALPAYTAAKTSFWESSTSSLGGDGLPPLPPELGLAAPLLPLPWPLPLLCGPLALPSFPFPFPFPFPLP